MPRETDVLTVAAVRTGPGKTTEYLFNERQSIFTAAPGAGADELPAALMRTAAERNTPLSATFDTKTALIHRVAEPPPRALAEFARRPAPLTKVAKPATIAVEKIDATNFNIANLHLKWPVFTQCTKIVPNYAKAKQIFDFCASLSCNLPGPFPVPPCIPFQYVRDGCYARAHQMYRIITTRYGYCCEKVFSFANQGNDRLAVKATKWGGCCVTWWYHVAPLLRVRTQIKGLKALETAYVIDPGMFDAPVLLSTWLAAQENKGCDANAHVSKYSIQPGTAYTPANFAGTAFGTDPTYALTEQTLKAYATLKTC